MTQLDREQLVEALEMAGLDEDALYEDYSGRGMYGDKCFGIVGGVGEVLLFAAALGSFADDWDWIGKARSDGMGLSTIWYWPGVQVASVEVGS